MKTPQKLDRIAGQSSRRIVRNPRPKRPSAGSEGINMRSVEGASHLYNSHFISKPFDLGRNLYDCETRLTTYRVAGMKFEELRQKPLKSPRKEQGEIVGSSRTMGWAC